MRAIAQTLFYEVRFIIIIFVLIILGERYVFRDFFKMTKVKEYFYFISFIYGFSY